MKLNCEGCIYDKWDYDRDNCKKCIRNENFHDLYQQNINWKKIDLEWNEKDGNRKAK